MNSPLLNHAADTERLKQLAAERCALEWGLLRLCPAHGERYQTATCEEHAIM